MPTITTLPRRDAEASDPSQITHADLQALLDVAAWQQAQIIMLANERGELIEVLTKTGEIITELRRTLKRVVTSPRYSDVEPHPDGLNLAEARARINRIREMTQ